MNSIKHRDHLEVLNSGNEEHIPVVSVTVLTARSTTNKGVCVVKEPQERGEAENPEKNGPQDLHTDRAVL